MRGDQVVPPSEVRQMPPTAEAANVRLGSTGSTAIELNCPVAVGRPGASPLRIGRGPLSVHDPPLMGIVFDGTSRASRCRRASRARDSGLGRTSVVTGRGRNPDSQRRTADTAMMNSSGYG